MEKDIKLAEEIKDKEAMLHLTKDYKKLFDVFSITTLVLLVLCLLLIVIGPLFVYLSGLLLFLFLFSFGMYVLLKVQLGILYHTLYTKKETTPE
ncbi:MAG: hypothetical protein K9L74_02380 [Candidatus Izimaplasma sp.]|nr:hypothetical protein [Candidatus Izimaplasma bacterium]